MKKPTSSRQREADFRREWRKRKDKEKPSSDGQASPDAPPRLAPQRTGKPSHR